MTDAAAAVPAVFHWWREMCNSDEPFVAHGFSIASTKEACQAHMDGCRAGPTNAVVSAAADVLEYVATATLDALEPTRLLKEQHSDMAHALSQSIPRADLLPLLRAIDNPDVRGIVRAYDALVAQHPRLRDDVRLEGEKRG